jgi:uncharacterized protein (DUF2141 family)
MISLRKQFAALSAGILCVAAAAAHATQVEVMVTGVKDTRGHVHVDICTRDTFLKDNCPYSGDGVSKPGMTVVKVDGVPPGDYAVQAFQDQTNEGVVHQGLLGVPKEPIGFSNDAPLRLRGPRFRDAVIHVGNEVKHVTLTLRHLFR